MKRAGPKMPARRMLSFSNLFSSIRSSRRGDGRRPNADDREPYSRMRHATADFTEADDDDESNEESNHDEDEDEEEEDDDEEDDNRRDSGTVLPLFSESHLDALPVYSITHAIRIIVQTRTETALTWDQLRSPQVSQFLVVSALQTPAFPFIRLFWKACEMMAPRPPRLEYSHLGRDFLQHLREILAFMALTGKHHRNQCRSRFASTISPEPRFTH